MLSTVRAIVRDGKIELLEPIVLPDAVQVLVTILSEDEYTFWQDVSESALRQVWDNDGDDIYTELLA